MVEGNAGCAVRATAALGTSAAQALLGARVTHDTRSRYSQEWSAFAIDYRRTRQTREPSLTCIFMFMFGHIRTLRRTSLIFHTTREALSTSQQKFSANQHRVAIPPPPAVHLCDHHPGADGGCVCGAHEVLGGDAVCVAVVPGGVQPGGSRGVGRGR